jgi:hypothetical protein
VDVAFGLGVPCRRQAGISSSIQIALSLNCSIATSPKGFLCGQDRLPQRWGVPSPSLLS